MALGVGMPDGALLDQFDLEHQPTAFSAFFSRVEKQAVKHGLPVSVGMEGYGGWARPLDEMVLAKGWKLLNVNNLKLLTRRRRQLVNERIMVVNRMYSDLQAIAPGLLGITGSVDNQWFLRFLTARDTFDQLTRLRQ
ncbi:MAG: hypothetical protein Q9M24_04225 [Mariprofundaceae bacterium]|nr:hypothetical protein [Mariprofundaceae bacterium]